MRWSYLSIRRACLGTALLFCASSVWAADAESTAFALIKEGNRFVGEQCKDRVMEIESEKSVGTLIPTLWRIRYYDPDATSKTTEVKFGAGQKLDVNRPIRVTFSKMREMDPEKLKVDSDAAIKTATSEPLLQNLKVVATRLWLEAKEGPDRPVWKVRLWAEKLRDKTKSVEIGEVYISAETGKVVRNELKIKRVD